MTPLHTRRSAYSVRRYGASMLGIMALAMTACAPPATEPSGPIAFCVTIQPLRAILAELAEGRAAVACLLPPGVSPHTYDVRPSDAQSAESALALFYVDDSLDGWAARLSARHRVRVFDLVPESMRLAYDEHAHEDGASHDHDHGPMDAHFWTDPLTVAAILDPLVAELTRLDPDGGTVYTANAVRWKSALAALDSEFKPLLAPHKGKSVVMFHPSFNYLLHRYGLKLAALIEPSPGKESAPQYLNSVIEAVKSAGVKAVFSEPQLPKRPAEVVAESAGVRVLELDPNGGSPGRESYADLMRYNVQTIIEAMP